MSKRLRIGVVGTGFGERVHVPAFRTDARCEVTAVCARHLEHARLAAQRLGLAHAFGSPGEMLSSGHVDAISIAVPPDAQPAIVIAAAEAGKHVFCEKPVAADEEGAARAFAAVQSARVVHAVDFIFPEIPLWQRAQSVLRSGELGKLRHAELSWRIETYAHASGLHDSWKTHWQNGGGTLANFVSHSFYYLEWLLGPVSRIAARLSPKRAEGDALVDAWLEMASGCPVSMSVAANAFMGSGHRLEIYGERGTLVLENRTGDYVNGFTLSVGTREKGAFATEPSEPPQNSDGRIGAVSAIARRFVDAALNGGTVEPNLAHGLRVQRLIAAARTANETGAWQSV